MYNTDTTLYMSEGELIESAGRIRAMIKRLRERNTRTDDLEWDLCYVQRELNLRADRAEMHRKLLEARSGSAPHEATASAKT
jgi:hypothetical protein